MSSNIEKIVGSILDKVRPLVREAIQQADKSARGEVLADVSKAIAGSKAPAKAKSAAKAAAPVAGVVKRGPGRPRKNPEAVAAAPVAAKPKKKATKAPRVMSDEVRKKLSDNLAKAREAKTDKATPVAGVVKRGPGRPRKVVPVATETAPAQA